MGKVYASSDWHGCWNPAYKVLEFLKPDDKLYFLGDAIDRGKDGIKILNTLLNDSRIFFIKGNHEDMMAKTIPDLINDEYNINDIWFFNGGMQTWESIESFPKEKIIEYINKINQMPTELIYNSPLGHSIILEHAGFSPFNIPHKSHDSLWDRNHFHDNWISDLTLKYNYKYKSLNPNTTFLIHGHTPVQYLKYTYGYKDQPPITIERLEEKREWYESCSFDTPFHIKSTIIRYCDSHKFNIDMCTIASGRIALLDLDTFEEFYFDEE